VNQVPYVEATLENGVGVWLQLDTGSHFGVTLWRDFVKAHPEVLTVPQKRWVQTSGIGGGAQLMESEIRTLHVLGRDYAKVAVIIQDAPAQGWHHPRVAGRVGLGLLKDRRVTVHPLMRRIWFEPCSFRSRSAQATAPIPDVAAAAPRGGAGDAVPDADADADRVKPLLAGRGRPRVTARSGSRCARGPCRGRCGRAPRRGSRDRTSDRT